MKKTLSFSLITLGLIFILSNMALAGDQLMTDAQEYFEPIPATAPVLEGNPATPAKVELGKILKGNSRLDFRHGCLSSFSAKKVIQSSPKFNNTGRVVSL